MFAVFAFFFNIFNIFQTPTVGDIISSVTDAMTDVISTTVIATIAIAGISLTLAWFGLRRVLRLGGR